MKMTEQVKQFIKENLDLIQENTRESWEEIYDKDFPVHFTETLLECGINPLECGLNYIPECFLWMSKIKEFTIPDSIESICNYAFDSCLSLTSIEIPDNVIDIGCEAFQGCKSLISVTISNSVTSIDPYAFKDCTSLTNIKYLGTKKEAIKCGIGDKSNETWREGSAISKIICNDGVIEL